ncbi:MAG: PadR family transcriptional regulator [Verrucomicrobiia bacterium]
MRLDKFAKDLVTGSYDLVILNALNRQPMYGYEIVRRVADQTKQTILWHRGTVYRVLHHLERRGLVARHRRRVGRSRERLYYRLTARGRVTWRRQRAQWQTFSGTVNALLGL